MGNPKVICVSAGIGFVLSFLIGIISGVGFGTIILRALIFAVVFAALSFGISFLYQSFLSDGAKVSSGSDGTETPVQKPAAGGVVNIVVDDSNLADEDSAPKFAVSSTRNTLGAQELSSGESEVHAEPAATVTATPAPAASVPASETAASVAEAKPANEPAGFVPAGLNTITSAEPAPAAGSAPAVGAQTAAPEAAAQTNAPASTAEALDVLPDIGNINLAESTANPVISDSDFASGGSSSGGSGSGQDTNVMAQAIRTLLAKD
ncbi:MAG: hypothetical protein KBT11_05895 [Treponema sp.]|nr:hypothetical protein [Candidatus Treponema equifaecale]